MGLFKSKQEKEMASKMLVRKTLTSMQKQIDKLEASKQVYIDAAKQAKQSGLNAQVNLAMSGLKMVMEQQKRVQEMKLNFEITAQLKDMSSMTNDFLVGLSSVSKDMIKLTDSKEFAKVQQQFEMAIAGNEMQAEQMEIFLDENQSSFERISSGNISKVSAKELENLVTENVMQDSIDSDIDMQIESIKKMLNKGGSDV